MNSVRSPGRSALLLVALLLVALLACRSKKEKKPDGITINKGADGKVSVSGGSPMSGDPKTCAAYQACCTLPDLGLACALTQTATKGDCAAALASIRKQISERALSAPEGCL
jgi:hypothetical protein